MPSQQGVPAEQPFHNAPAGGREAPLRHGALPQLLLRQDVASGRQAGQLERQLLHLQVQAALPRDLHRAAVHHDDRLAGGLHHKDLDERLQGRVCEVRC